MTLGDIKDGPILDDVTPYITIWKRETNGVWMLVKRGEGVNGQAHEEL